MTTHTLKTWPKYYIQVKHGYKTVELRKDDRGFQAGDILVLEEWDPRMEMYTGRAMERIVTHVLRGFPGLAEGYVALSMRSKSELEAIHGVVNKPGEEAN